MKTSVHKNTTNDLLFEIGCEELPATNLADIFESTAENVLEIRLKKILEEKRIGFKSCRVWATPRRLVFLTEAVEAAQQPKEERIKIISKEEGYDAGGAPTPKLLTILKHRGVAVGDVMIEEFNGKPFIFLKKSEGVRKTQELLPEIFEALVKSLGFPKNMKWDESGIYFPRPIRNFLCFYGDKPVLFKIGQTHAKPQTIIFSKAKRSAYNVKNIPAYFSLLKKRGVILDPVERKAAIQKNLEKLAASYKGKLYEDPFLLNEVNFLVESPQGLAAPFGEEFLKLPLEVLAVSMARKQRIFGLVGSDGKIMPKFLAVLDGAATSKQAKVISFNIENILHAKLQDSLFFYKEDTKAPLEKKRDELKNLIFLKNAGSMLEKSQRLEHLASVISAELSLSGQEKTNLSRAAKLSKADLLTQMVGEFPELQGVIGRYYALESREEAAVAEAIGQQYLPRTVQDRLPESKLGALLSILDKTDLVVASFALGNEPTSSLDPFGLRRSASAVLKILIEKKIPLSLKQLLEQNKKELGAYVQKDKEEALLKKLDFFFKDRFKALMTDKGFREDLVEAVMATSFEKPYEVFCRVEALSKIASKETWNQSWKVVERTANILKGNKEALGSSPDPSVFTEALEHRVFESYQKSSQAILKAAQAQDFALATSLYAGAFFDILIEFFEKVFVNAEDLAVRKNRLTLLKSVNRLYADNIADLSKIRL